MRNTFKKRNKEIGHWLKAVRKKVKRVWIKKGRREGKEEIGKTQRSGRSK